MKIKLSLLLTAALVGGFSNLSTSLADDKKPVIYVPVPPYAGLTESLVGDLAEVRTIASKDDDPHVYLPTPKELAQLSVGTVYFAADLSISDRV